MYVETLAVSTSRFKRDPSSFALASPQLLGVVKTTRVLTYSTILTLSVP